MSGRSHHRSRRHRRSLVAVWFFAGLSALLLAYAAWGLVTHDHEYHYARSFCSADSNHPGRGYTGDELRCYDP